MKDHPRVNHSQVPYSSLQAYDLIFWADYATPKKQETEIWYQYLLILIPARDM